MELRLVARPLKVVGPPAFPMARVAKGVVLLVARVLGRRVALRVQARALEPAVSPGGLAAPSGGSAMPPVGRVLRRKAAPVASVASVASVVARVARVVPELPGAMRKAPALRERLGVMWVVRGVLGHLVVVRAAPELPGVARVVPELPEVVRAVRGLPGMSQVVTELPRVVWGARAGPGVPKAVRRVPGLLEVVRAARGVPGVVRLAGVPVERGVGPAAAQVIRGVVRVVRRVVRGVRGGLRGGGRRLRLRANVPLGWGGTMRGWP